MVITAHGHPCKGPFACWLGCSGLSLHVSLARVCWKQSQEMFSRGLAQGIVNIFACICLEVIGHRSAWWSRSHLQASGAAFPAGWVSQTHAQPLAVWWHKLAAAIRSCAMKPVHVGNLHPGGASCAVSHCQGLLTWSLKPGLRLCSQVVGWPMLV